MDLFFISLLLFIIIFLKNYFTMFYFAYYNYIFKNNLLCLERNKILNTPRHTISPSAQIPKNIIKIMFTIIYSPFILDIPCYT